MELPRFQLLMEVLVGVQVRDPSPVGEKRSAREAGPGLGPRAVLKQPFPLWG